MSALEQASLDVTREDGASLAQPGKYLLFQLAGERYGLPILQVREIISLEAITRVPRTSACVLGVINLRGRVIPVMDLRTRFDLENAPATDETVIIVLQCELSDRRLTIGVVVDDVQEVVSLRAEHVSAPPPGTGLEDEFILGIGTPQEGQIIFLLDVDAIVRFDEADVLLAADRGIDNS
ncbi:MAG: purine-binding chemotaxis protein CheW [Myxococcales bacterium]|nr:purine-binding chemotaxis protein CheW [Myxococcales bacterium]